MSLVKATVPPASGKVMVRSAVGLVTLINVSLVSFVDPSKIIDPLVILIEFEAAASGTLSVEVFIEVKPSISDAVAPSATAVLPIVMSSLAS